MIWISVEIDWNYLYDVLPIYTTYYQLLSLAAGKGKPQKFVNCYSHEIKKRRGYWHHQCCMLCVKFIRSTESDRTESSGGLSYWTFSSCKLDLRLKRWKGKGEKVLPLTFSPLPKYVCEDYLKNHCTDDAEANSRNINIFFHCSVHFCNEIRYQLANAQHIKDASSN